MNLTGEQITEVLNRLKSYTHWMYYNPEGIERFSNLLLKHEGRQFMLNLNEDGLYTLTESESKKVALWEVICKTSKPVHGIDNVDISWKLVNKEDFNEKWVKIFEEIGVFVASAFQRVVAMTWIFRMHQETANVLVKDLLLLNTNENL